MRKCCLNEMHKDDMIFVFVSGGSKGELEHERMLCLLLLRLGVRASRDMFLGSWVLN